MSVLYGVGVGSGDPELMTLKAVRVIKECQVIVVPTEEVEQSVAYQIVKEVVPDLHQKELIGLHMPMVKDESLLQVEQEKSANAVISKLMNGKNVAFLTLGDATIYSTYTYIQKIVEEKGYETRIISGIPSFLSAAAQLNTKLVIRDEHLHIIPSVYGISEALPLKGTKVFMKAGKHLMDIKQQLNGVNQKVYFIENCGMVNERIIEGVNEMPDVAGYYSMVIVSDS